MKLLVILRIYQTLSATLKIDTRKAALLPSWAVDSEHERKAIKMLVGKINSTEKILEV